MDDRVNDTRQMRREAVGLALLFLVAFLAFLATQALARHEDATRRGDAAAWYDVGQQRLDEGRLDAAVEALRRATSLDRGQRTYAASLARALAAADRSGEARRVLLPLRSADPGDPEVNLALARIAAGQGTVDDAVHFYRSALYGAWPDERLAARREVRLELARLLIRHGRRDAALGELTALGSSPADSTADLVTLGALFLEAGDAARALAAYRRVLDDAPTDPGALNGAGESAFALGRYAEARRYLSALSAPSPRAVHLREVAEHVLGADPLAPRISAAERRRRLAAALSRAQERIDACLARPDLSAEARERLTTALADPPPGETAAAALDAVERIEQGLGRVLRLERAAAGICPATRLDEALRLIAERLEEPVS